MFPPNGMDSNKIEGKENEIIKAKPSQEATRPQKLAVKAFIQLDGNETDPDIEEKPDDSNGNGPDIEEKPDDSNGNGPARRTRSSSRLKKRQGLRNWP